MCVMNDPFGHTHSPGSSDHYSHMKLVLFCDILKSEYTCTEVQTHYWPLLWFGLVDIKIKILMLDNALWLGEATVSLWLQSQSMLEFEIQRSSNTLLENHL